MPEITRRRFIQGLLATTALAASPAALSQAINNAELTGIIQGRTFYVTRPLHIYDVGVRIYDCVFEAQPLLNGRPLLIFHNVSSLIDRCTFNTNGYCDYIIGFEHPMVTSSV